MPDISKSSPSVTGGIVFSIYQFCILLKPCVLSENRQGRTPAMTEQRIDSNALVAREVMQAANGYSNTYNQNVSTAPLKTTGYTSH